MKELLEKLKKLFPSAKLDLMVGGVSFEYEGMKTFVSSEKQIAILQRIFNNYEELKRNGF
ncbi:MAG: hypothetical protein KDK36_20225 [Leptospiraceae bacterium]|nr:hypothetical protein [Leptospiraceae bacterium]